MIFPDVFSNVVWRAADGAAREAFQPEVDRATPISFALAWAPPRNNCVLANVRGGLQGVALGNVFLAPSKRCSFQRGQESGFESGDAEIFRFSIEF